MAADAIKAFLTNDVFDAAGVLGGRLRAHAKAHQPVSDEQVALQHFFRLGESLGREPQEAVFIGGHQPQAAQIGHSHGHAGPGKVQMVGHVHGADIAVLFLQHENGFQVILPRFLHAHAVRLP